MLEKLKTSNKPTTETVVSKNKTSAYNIPALLAGTSILASLLLLSDRKEEESEATPLTPSEKENEPDSKNIQTDLNSLHKKLDDLISKFEEFQTNELTISDHDLLGNLSMEWLEKASKLPLEWLEKASKFEVTLYLLRALLNDKQLLESFKSEEVQKLMEKKKFFGLLGAINLFLTEKTPKDEKKSSHDASSSMILSNSIPSEFSVEKLQKIIHIDGYKKTVLNNGSTTIFIPNEEVFSDIIVSEMIIFKLKNESNETNFFKVMAVLTAAIGEYDISKRFLELYFYYRNKINDTESVEKLATQALNKILYNLPQAVVNLFSDEENIENTSSSLPESKISIKSLQEIINETLKTDKLTFH